jgi:DNA-binding NarL/FixJ family response regulator
MITHAHHEEGAAVMSIRVVIADDHSVVRKGIKDLLTDEGDIVVVGEARTGQEAIDLALALTPDVVVVARRRTPRPSPRKVKQYFPIHPGNTA